MAYASLNIINTDFVLFLVHFLVLLYLQDLLIDQDSISSYLDNSGYSLAKLAIMVYP
jgi:hypothetical protein